MSSSGNSGRPRSNAFLGYEMHEQMTGISKTQMDGMRIQDKRMRLATKAMDHARGIVHAPANVERVEGEDARFDEFHNTATTRAFVKQALLPGVKEAMPDKENLSYNFGALAATTSMRREGRCMEMSSSVLDYLGQKTKKYQQKLADPEISDQDREKYQFKMQAIGSVNLMEGVNPHNQDDHMWVRLGAEDDPNSVSADAWGRGSAVPSDRFRGNELFTSQRKASSFTPKMMSDLSDISADIQGRQNVREYVGGLKHDIPSEFRGSTPSQPQHSNE